AMMNGRVVAIVAFCAAILAALVAASSAARPPSAQFGPGAKWVEVIKVDGSINPAVADYIEASLASAEADGARALVIELDTPGGLLNSAQRIVKDLLNSRVPVIVYVAPSGASATSAGTFITFAANIAAMAPGTTIGAAHPVEGTGQDISGAMGEKVENYAASFAMTIAQRRGRNKEWVEQAVRKSVSIGEREALEKHVVDIVATNLDDLLRQASGRKVEIDGKEVTLELDGAAQRVAKMTIGQRLLNTLADPNLVYLLLMAGMLGLYFEFSHPGVFFPGVAGAICLLLALASFQVLPVNLTGLLLIVLGIGLLVAEVFVTSFGVLGLGGVIAFVVGSLFLIDSSETNIVVNRSIVFGAAAGMTAIILGVGYLVARDRMRTAQTGREALIGEIGEVREPIAPGAPGKIFVHGEHWRAAGAEPIAAGQRARITKVSGLEVTVERVG
ncbi:MAG: NfeD family protein, partial [Candidatus Binataceae bacterium]